MKKYILLIFFSLSALSFAHLEGESVTAGGYKIELSTIPEDLMVEVNSDIVISIENAATGERIRGAAFWARLSMNDTALLSSSDFVTNDLGSSDINYVFQKPGHYRLDITPEGGSVATFHLRVLEEYRANNAPLYMAAAAAVFFIIGLAVGFIFSRRAGK